MFALQNRWAALALMFLAGLNLPMQFQSVAALGPLIVADLGVGYAEIGVLTGLYMVPGIFLAGPSALLAARIGDRLTVAAGVALMSLAAVLFVATDSYAVMFASRLLGGAGGVVITVFLPKVVTDWFVGREIATAQSLMASSFGLGVGLALAVLPSLAAEASWRAAMLANAGVGAVSLGLLLMLYRDCPAGRPRDRRIAPTRISREEAILAGIAGSGRGLFSTGYVVFMGFAPTLLLLQGMTIADASQLVSLVAAVSAVSVPLGGYLSDRTGRTDWFIVLGAVGTAATCYLLPHAAPAVLWILLFGLFRGGCTGGIMAMPALALRPESRRAGFAIASSVYFILMAAFPAFAGLLLDLTGDASVPIWFAGALWLAILGQLAAFRLLRRRWQGGAGGAAGPGGRT